MSRIALVTGAAGGIGRASALELARAGFRVAVLDINPVGLESVAAELSTLGLLAGRLRCSVSDGEAVAGGLEDLVQREGRLDVLVNCAGIGMAGDVAATPLERWREVLEVNLTGTFVPCHAALRWMLKAKSGHIVNVISQAGKAAFAGQGAYCASKWGALALTRVLALEVRAQGIRVTAVCPGAVDTPFWDTTGLRLDRRLMLSPDAVAQAIAHVVSISPGTTVDEIDLMPAAGVLPHLDA